jgi:fluoride exporter
VERLLLVAAGGAIGAALRYLVATAVLGWLGPAFPWGTLIVNFSGSFLIGLVQSMAAEGLVLGEDTRLFLTSGVLGGFTTYSAFSYESVRLMESGAWGSAWLNIAATTAACLTLCFLGLWAGRAILAPR